jgi:hypothetical protein
MLEIKKINLKVAEWEIQVWCVLDWDILGMKAERFIFAVAEI